MIISESMVKVEVEVKVKVMVGIVVQVETVVLAEFMVSIQVRVLVQANWKFMAGLKVIKVFKHLIFHFKTVIGLTYGILILCSCFFKFIFS